MQIKKILPVFSYLFHPIFISLYGVLMYIQFAQLGINSITLLLLIQVIILTVLLPLSIYSLMKALGNIQSFTEASIKQRRLPIFLQAAFLFILIKYNQYMPQFPALFFFFAGGFIAAIMALLGTFLNFKVSLHMIGICSLLVFLISLSLYFNYAALLIIAGFIVITGCVATSRLYMKSHTIEELVAGAIIGIFSQLAMW
ncbi:MAG TPA: hypothetical protein DDZ41_01095, partial [Flavobacterium sp.]|nr:hypothetical protein [Flavobacterium sp.]